jgi:hypothetical protein
MDLAVGLVERPEEAQALQMVQVEVAEQDIDSRAGLAFKRKTEWAHSGPGVQDQDRSVLAANFDARGVAAVPESVRPRRS